MYVGYVDLRWSLYLVVPTGVGNKQLQWNFNSSNWGPIFQKIIGMFIYIQFIYLMIAEYVKIIAFCKFIIHVDVCWWKELVL